MTESKTTPRHFTIRLFMNERTSSDVYVIADYAEQAASFAKFKFLGGLTEEAKAKYRIEDGFEVVK